MTQRKWKNVLLLLLMLFLIFGSYACSTKDVVSNEDIGTESIQNNEEKSVGEQPDGQPAEAQGPGTYGPFWQVSHNGNLVYLLGSIHIAKPELYPLHEKIETAFTESQVLAVEIDVADADLMKLQTDIMNKARYSDGSTLKQHVPPYEYTKLKNRLKEHNINIAMFESYEPWYISMMLDSLLYLKIGYDPELGIDNHFLKQAKGKKEVIELETAEFQLDLLDRFSEELQLAQLRGSLRSFDVLQKELESMFEIWKSGDDEDLLTFIDGSLGETEMDQKIVTEFNEAMLDNRNIGMTDKIEGFLKSEQKGTYFVVVGAAHYVGDMGIVKLLEDRGYTVEKQDWSK